MKKVITYGTFDLLHQGHINLLRRAKELGDWLIVGVTTDKFDLERGKMNSYDNLMTRIEAVKSTGYADQVIIEEYKGQKIDDIQKYGVDIFAIGSDWVGYFDYLKEYCDVVYLPRTEGISSTLLREGRPSVKVGILGSENVKQQFIRESGFVNSIVIDDDYEACQAVYIASEPMKHYQVVKDALEKGKHVLCEAPLVFSTSQADELFSLADKKGLVLMLALKTAYCPAFGHLVSLLKSGVIGKIMSIDASIRGNMCEMAVYPILAIFKLMGTDYRDVFFFTKKEDGCDVFTKAVFLYESTVASFQTGSGVESGNDLIISGTKGYAYVPAPWWKTDYFEIRYEDKNLDKKCFYPFAGEGLRYEIKDFVSCILQGSFQKLSRQEIRRLTDVQERYSNGNGVFEFSE